MFLMQIPLISRRFLFAATCLTLISAPVLAQAKDVTVAVAANFTEPAKEIAKAFEAKTGNHVVLSFGASGNFFSQIEQSAPFEVFLSADSERPAKLEADGFGIKGTRYTYAIGTLVLWSATPGLVDGKGAVLGRGQFEHIAIADPAAAPYGTAAIETMKALNLYDKLSPKIVKGASISQTYTFVNSGAAELGFISLSQVYKFPRGSIWYVPKSYYSRIDQEAILLKPGADAPEARAFLDFLKSPESIRIIKSYGYEVQ
jgi:molybdate transport system substrate-binding protein